MNETETFQHYQVLRREDGTLWELGRGAMGVTFKAFDVNLRCEVALKVISNQYLDNEMARARFLREARAAAGLRHRNVASVYHLGNDAESFFYSMEFIDGQTVESLVNAQGPLSCADALQIALQAARALGAAAKQGLVHRDIKPANLMVVREDEDDEGFVVKVIDFGLARPAIEAGQSGHITMGGFVGTPQYASPEQIEERDLDTRSDIYSLGITLWYMLVGQPPFTGSVFQISSQHLTTEPPWDRLGGSIPEPVRALLALMLQKDPANRPQTPAKLRAEIEACLRQLSAGSSSMPLTSLPLKAAPDAGLLPPDVPGRPNDSVAAPESSAAASATVVQGPAPKAGTIFAGRYQLAELIAESSGGRVYRAYDGRQDGRTVAVKVLRVGLGLSPHEFYHLQGDLGRLRYATHPNLIETFVLERIHGYKYCVMEWVCGFTLRDLLLSQGSLALRDTFNLVGQASDAASFCSANRFHRLELAPHRAMVHFPALANDETPPAFGAILAQGLSQWPAFQLKLDALAPTREGTVASVGSATRMAGRDTSTSIRGLVEGSYFHALGLLLYELLAGVPLPAERVDNIAPLPALSEEGNAILRRALSTNPGFGNENEFFGALLAASNLRRDEIGLPRALVEEVSIPKPATVARVPASPDTSPEPVQARAEVSLPPALPLADEGAETAISAPQPNPSVESIVAPAVTPPPPEPVVEAKVDLPVAEPPAQPLSLPVSVATPRVEPVSHPPVVTPVREAEPVVVRQLSTPPLIDWPLPVAIPPVAEKFAPVVAAPPEKTASIPRAGLEPTDHLSVQTTEKLSHVPPEIVSGAEVAEPTAAPSVPAAFSATTSPLREAGGDAARRKNLPVAVLSLAAVIVAGGIVGIVTWSRLKSPHPAVITASREASTPALAIAGKISSASQPTNAVVSTTETPAISTTPLSMPQTVAEIIPASTPPAPIIASAPADTPPLAASTPPSTNPPVAVLTDQPTSGDSAVIRTPPTPGPSAETPRPATVRDSKPSPRPATIHDAASSPKPAPKLTAKPTPKPIPRAAKPTPPRNNDDPPPGFMR